MLSTDKGMHRAVSFPSLKIAIGADHGGFLLKEDLKDFLQGLGCRVIDMGTYNKESCDYPVFSFKVAKAVATAKASRGVVICKSGIGSSIACNKIPGIRASLCYNMRQARLSRQHNDANILVLGAYFVSLQLAERILKAWLTTPFEAGRHSRRVGRICQMEKKLFKRTWKKIA